MSGTIRASLLAVVLLLAPAMADAGPPTTTGAPAADETIIATPTLVREIQFMLLNLSIDPGPIDGNAQQLTNRALHIFQQRSGLPEGDLVNGQPISAALVDRLHKEVAQNFLAGSKPEQNAAAAPTARIRRIAQRSQAHRRNRAADLPSPSCTQANSHHLKSCAPTEASAGWEPQSSS